MRSALEEFCLIMMCCLHYGRNRCNALKKQTCMKSRIIGVKACMESFDFLFGLMLGQTTCIEI